MSDGVLPGRMQHLDGEGWERLLTFHYLRSDGHRGYHGLLDWRLGLGFLRALVDRSYRAGLDGKWESLVELRDWPNLALTLAEEVARMRPGQMEVSQAGPLSLPVLTWRRAGSAERYVLVHPFWELQVGPTGSELLRRTLATLGGGDVHFVDTFEVARRPIRALDAARERPTDEP